MNPSHRTELRALLLLLMLVAVPLRAGGGGLPEPFAEFTAEYSLGNGSVRLGTTTISLQPHQSGWRYRSVTTADGLVKLLLPGRATESTVLERHADGLRPIAYLHREPEEEETVAVEFDWVEGMATAETTKKTHQYELEAGMRDGFTATLALIRALAAGQERVTIPVIDDKGERERLIFNVTGRETVKVPYGRFETVRVERERKGSSRETITWLAPELHWVAVRVDQRDDGELEARMELIDLEGPAGAGAKASEDAQTEAPVAQNTPPKR